MSCLNINFIKFWWHLHYFGSGHLILDGNHFKMTAIYNNPKYVFNHIKIVLYIYKVWWRYLGSFFLHKEKKHLKDHKKTGKFFVIFVTMATPKISIHFVLYVIVELIKLHQTTTPIFKFKFQNVIHRCKAYVFLFLIFC